MDGRTDGRRLDGYTISSPCEPNGSGELKSLMEIQRGFAEHLCIFLFALIVSLRKSSKYSK